MFTNAIILAEASIILAGAAEVTVVLIGCSLVPHVDLKKKKKKIYRKQNKNNDISQKKISISSPIAKGLLSKKVGEIANITTPSGVLAFKIINIYRD